MTSGNLAATPTGTLPPHSRRTLRTWAFCAIAILVCLAVPAVALGGTGIDNPNGSTNQAAPDAAPPTQPSNVSGNADANAVQATAASTESATVAPDQANENANGNNGNGSVSADGNSTAVVPQPDAAPRVKADSSSSNGNAPVNDPPGNSGNAPVNDHLSNSGSALELSGSAGNSGHAANANANPDSSQDKPGVDVKVGQPGDNGAVAQGNNSTAAAAAGASGGSSGAGAAQQTAAGSADSSGSDAAPNGAAALAPSQADSTGGETIPVANSPPGGEPASDPAATGSAATATTVSAGDSTPTVLDTSPSVSYVNGASSGPATPADAAGNPSSPAQATDVTSSLAPNAVPTGTQATAVTPDSSAANASVNTATATATATSTQTEPTNLNASIRVLNPGDNGHVAQTNDSTATAAAGAVGGATTALPQATSTQVDPTNINASVRILSPGDNGRVSQTNDSSAAAAAGAAGGQATARPEATSTQVDPHNVNVSIRVGSPGDDAPITQVNTSTATAAPVDPGAINEATVDLPASGPNSAADVQNFSQIVQDLAQCNADSSCLPSPTAGPATASAPVKAPDQSTATATQQAPSNVSVSVRVASPGKDSAVNQLNNASADGAASVTTKTDPENLVLAVVVPGDPSKVAIPTDPGTPWNWVWNWTTGTAPTAPDSTPISTPDWNWNWTAPADATATEAPAAVAAVPAPQPGHWTWTWIWTRGDGWTTTWTHDQPCSCTWSWVWNWTWPADTQAPPKTDTTPADIPAPPTDAQVVQTNTSSAAAVALTTFDGQQTSVAATDGNPGLATAYQGITSDQTALATADAAQTRPFNLSVVTAGRIQRIIQSNETLAAASAAALDTATQSIRQNQVGTNDGAVHAVDAAQVISTTQSATASSRSAQADAANIVQVWSKSLGNQALIGAISQKNRAVTATYAVVASETTQSIDQSQTGGGAEQLATALQAAIVTQAHRAAVQVAQASVKNRATIEIPWNGIWNPPIDQSNEVSAAAVSTAYSGIFQTIVQEASGEGIAWEEHAVQTAIVIQSGAASGSAEQSFRENVAGWNGVVASDAPAGGNGFASQSAASTAGPDGGLIFGTPPLPAGVHAGHVHGVSLSSGLATLKKSPWQALPAGTSNATPARPLPTGSGSATSGSEQYRHILLALLGAMSSTLGVFFGTTPFAALLALFMIAALGVGRLQYTVPALGRPADFARRERPG